MSDALFIDASNLNVLYKTGGKFVLGLSYLSCPEKLVIDAQALGNAYDIYVSMWPRPEGEGDRTIPGLSHGRVPFVVLEEELRAVLKYVSSFPGANNIYLCNALANFIIPSRVSNFQAVIPCGSRFALLDVKDKILDRLVMFNTQRDFYEVMGEDFTCYGDTDIVDVDTIRAQYPELAEFKKNVLIPLIPLITSYHSSYSITAAQCMEYLDGPEPEPEKKPVEPEIKKEAPLPEPVEVPKPKEPKKQKVKFDFVAALFAVIFCAAMFVIGLGYSTSDIEAAIRTQTVGASNFQNSAEPYQRIQAIYDNNYGLAGDAVNVLSFAKVNENGVTVSRAEANIDGVRLSFSCASADVKDAFVAYLNTKFVVSKVNEGDSISNTDGTVTQQYSAIIVP